MELSDIASHFFLQALVGTCLRREEGPDAPLSVPMEVSTSGDAEALLVTHVPQGECGSSGPVEGARGDQLGLYRGNEGDAATPASIT